MATFYVDFENGNNANNGTTFADRWKTLANGATAARIAPGDEIRIMASPNPTSLGQNGVWTSQALQAAATIASSTNTTPISITRGSHGYSTGDTVVITGHTVNTNANGTWEITVTGASTFTLNGSTGNGVGGATGTARLRNNTVVRLTSSVTQNIASTGPGRAAWTTADAVNVTTSFNTTDFKQHNQSDSIAIGAGFVTGKAAYWTLPSAVDLSGYQQVSFWIRQAAGTVGDAGAVDLRLCSDTLGNTAVNTISIPNLVVTGRWMPVTVDLGANLGSSIQSIALYVNTDNGAQTFLLNNIIACKASSSADSLTLTSLIGKNISGETFWGIQSINGTRVMLDGEIQTQPTSTNCRGYYGTSGTVATWKRETIKRGPTASASFSVEFIQDSGAAEQLIAYSGGWDRTDMSTQNGETWMDGLNGLGRAIENSRQLTSVTKMAFVRYANVLRLTTNANEQYYDLVAMNNCYEPVNQLGGSSGSITIGSAVANGGYGIEVYNSRYSITVTGSVVSNTNSGIRLASNVGRLSATDTHLVVGNNGAWGVVLDGAAYMDNIKTRDNVSGGLIPDSLTWAKNCLFNESVEVSPDQLSDNYVYSHNHDQVAGNHKIFVGDGLISAVTDQRYTASGLSWKLQPLSSTWRYSRRPLILSLAKVACSANNLVTIKAWMRRSNTGLTMRLVCKGGQIAGVASDVVDSMTAAADTWAEQTITFTPTEVGVVEITAEAWGGTTFSGWVDDMTISQA
jgi:hypothetical protein